MSNDIEKFIKIYNESCKKDIAEKTLENSTELTDENTENIQNESFGKWMKHLIVKGKDARNKELKNTILAVLKQFNFQSVENADGDINRTLYSKGQGKYDIYILLDKNLFVKNSKKNYPKCNLTITVLNAKTKNNVGTEKIKVNHSWTQEELIDELNNALQDICDIELSTAYRQISQTNNNENGSSNNWSPQNYPDQSSQMYNPYDFKQIEKFSGLNKQNIYNTAKNSMNGNKQELRFKLQYLCSGLSKLTDEERDLIKEMFG